MNYLISVGCISLLFGCAGAETGKTLDESPSQEPEFDAKVDAVNRLAKVEAVALKVPGLAIGVVQGGKLVSVHGFGTSELAGGINGDTVFRVGSITKVFTAAATMRLRDDGRLDLDDPVAKHIPELASVLSPSGKEPVRVRHLLQHSSGIPTLGDGSLDWTRGPAITEAQVIKSVKNATLAFEPGTRSEYSNVGMALAGVVVSRASGTSYREYVSSTILAPLEMEASKWDRSAYQAGAVFPGYVREGDTFKQPDGYWDMGAIDPAGGLHSTVKDMARFLAFQADPAAMSSVMAEETVLESQTKTEMPKNSHMGMGWIVEADPDLGKIVWHNGATYSYGAWAGIDPERDNGVVVFVSTGDLGVVDRAGRLGKDALRILAGLEPRYTK